VSPVRTTSTYPRSNPFTPPIPQPTTDTKNLAACVEALKACVESLIGQRGDAANRAITFNDLVAYGLLDSGAVESPSGSTTLGENELITLSGDATGSGTTAISVAVIRLRGWPVSADAPAAAEVLTWNGTAWEPALPPAPPMPVTIGYAPPAAASQGALWWDSVSGQLYVYYDDGTSAQWVVANALVHS
jgi:hypothetical protein